MSSFRDIHVSEHHCFKKVIDNENYTRCLEWAVFTANEKLKNTADTWQLRNPNAKIVDILSGDLAKNIVKQFIEENSEHEVIEFDAIRDDNFVNTDAFDLMIGEYEIEVKSSLEKYSKDVNILYTKRNIIINQHHSHLTKSRYIFQVFYVPNDLSSFKKIEKLNKNGDAEFSTELFENHLNLFALENLDVYICGWVDQYSIQTNQSYGISNLSTQASYRSYTKLLIENSNNPDLFFDIDFR